MTVKGPTSWTIVVTFGVVSISLLDDHQRVLSAIMMWFTAAGWVFLTVLLAVPLVVHYGRLWRGAAPPAELTIVAATAALGTRLALGGHRTVAAVLLVLTAIEWAGLSAPVLRRWVTPTVGISFLVSVAADSVALLSATLAVPLEARWLCVAAFLLMLLGLCLYLFVATRFDPRQLLVARGDHWILGGALAISALSTASATRAAATLGVFREHHHALTYAACGFVVGAVTGIGGIVEYARVWTWVAFAVTLVLLAGLARSSRPGTTPLPAAEHAPALQHEQKSE